MGSLFEWITDWIKEGLIDAITGQYTSIFNSVNNQVADVANQVGQTPQGWNGGVPAISCLIPWDFAPGLSFP